ncbi:MAG: hypothetical protein VXZ53_16725, partial [Planctomycetota bacterium]|nr:hypothetical protein [Planctomycetota bacterium]
MPIAARAKLPWRQFFEELEAVSISSPLRHVRQLPRWLPNQKAQSTFPTSRCCDLPWKLLAAVPDRTDPP